MKNLQVYFTCSLFFLLLFAWGTTKGQGTIEKTDYGSIINGGQIIDVEEGAKITDPNNGEEILMLSADANCTVPLYVSVFFTNVNLDSEEGNWPPSPGMALEITMGTTTLPLVNITASPQEIHPAGDIPMWIFEETVEIDADIFCHSGVGTVGSPNGELYARLINTETDNPYNLSAQSAEGSLFECEAYDDCTQGVFSTVVVSRLYQVDCTECQSPPESQEGSKHEFSRSAEVNAPINSLSIAPNPFQDYTTLNYQLSQDREVSLTVFDATGKVVDQSIRLEPVGNHQKVIDTQAWAPGIYFLQLNTEDQTTGMRMIKY